MQFTVRLMICNDAKFFFFSYAAIGGNLTWLQRQQQKLKERRDLQRREERQNHETRLFSELRTVHSRHMRPTASHRLDGYTSDTTAFADDDDDFSIPLHINTTAKVLQKYIYQMICFNLTITVTF